MIAFHSHFLPAIDDGSDCVETSLEMLRESYRQGIDLIFATPHFYADEVDPEFFLKRRNRAYALLREAMEEDGGDFPEIRLGAEILFFPGMSVADELVELSMDNTPFLLIEPPMMPWRDSMLDEIELTGQNLHRIPVIAHVDRYMRYLRDSTLFERLEDRRVLIQVNADFFLHSSSVMRALDYLRARKIQFIGSDCHNLTNRAPNIGYAAEVIRNDGAEEYLQAINDRIYSFLSRLASA